MIVRPLPILFALLMTFATAIAALAQGASPASAADFKLEIEHQIRARLDASALGDIADWGRYVLDDCLCGPGTKVSVQQEIAGRPATLKNWYGDITGLEVRRYGDTALVRYGVTEYSELGGQRLGLPLLRSETHVLRDGAWKFAGGADTVLPVDPPIARVDPKIFDSVVGQYEYAKGVVDTVTRDGDRLMIQSSGQPKDELFAEDESTYFVKGQDWRIIFVRDANARVTSIRFRLHSQDLVAKRIK